jgi:hypothetical protein
MDKILIRIFKILSVIIIILGVVFFVLVVINAKVLETDLGIQAKVLDPFANLMYITLLIAAVLAVIFPLIHAVMNPKQLLKFIIILAGLVIVGFVAYSLADNQFDIVRLQKLKTTAEESKIVGAALLFTYFTAGLTVLSLLVFSIFSFFKR